MPPLSRSAFMPVVLFAAGALSVVGYGYITRDGAVRVTPSTPAAQAHRRAAPAQLFQGDESAGTPAAAYSAEQAPATDEKPAPIVTPENVATWVAQADGNDAARRAAAIESLASAPKADAVPALERVLKVADDGDRPRALRSLRTLAQREGDADDRIRTVVRNIVFHADDEATTQAAQAMLDDIERDLSEAASNRR